MYYFLLYFYFFIRVVSRGTSIMTGNISYKTVTNKLAVLVISSVLTV